MRLSDIEQQTCTIADCIIVPIVTRGFYSLQYQTLCLLTTPFKWKAASSEKQMLFLFLGLVNNGNSI